MVQARMGPLAREEEEDPLQVLDLYAGSGALGLEALSRGAASATMVDHERSSVRIIKANVAHLGAEDRCRVLAMGVKPALKLLSEERRLFGLVLADPPYAEDPRDVLELIWGAGVLRPGGMLALEHHKRAPAPEAAGEGETPPLVKVTTRYHGDTGLSLYSFPLGQRGVK